ncbi:MAG: hypothetical protein HYX51_07090 [Chloroflexi bacterium]|nr:hypothetical protein [Chloroflexota bacterium]
MTSTAAIVEFAVVNARGTIPDPKGGPPAFVVGHQLALHVVVAPVVGMVRLSTSSGPLSPAADIVSVDVYPDALGVADVVLSVPGRPDRVFADAYLRDDLERACRARDPWLVVERMLRLQMGP